MSVENSRGNFGKLLFSLGRPRFIFIKKILVKSHTIVVVELDRKALTGFLLSFDDRKSLLNSVHLLATSVAQIGNENGDFGLFLAFLDIFLMSGILFVVAGQSCENRNFRCPEITADGEAASPLCANLFERTNCAWSCKLCTGSADPGFGLGLPPTCLTVPPASPKPPEIPAKTLVVQSLNEARADVENALEAAEAKLAELGISSASALIFPRPRGAEEQTKLRDLTAEINRYISLLIQLSVSPSIPVPETVDQLQMDIKLTIDPLTTLLPLIEVEDATDLKNTITALEDLKVWLIRVLENAGFVGTETFSP